ncbi:hypothetical protein C8A05DRAFT_39828 [Staphylotrichum tortipilum]|uniref:Uncharacterized protein n=1 Tax=Staphylotrichum tortipilum TaxID=2831512 RepID=A0AAN6MAY0_9PEZI|nr:hypothetical protein C8A05DRAFT_39828 [Staphylotrichum longicolle]
MPPRTRSGATERNTTDSTPGSPLRQAAPSALLDRLQHDLDPSTAPEMGSQPNRGQRATLAGPRTPSRRQHSTSPSASPEETLEAMRRHLRELEELKKLEHQIKEARKRLGITKEKRRRQSDSSSSSDSGTRAKAIKITNIIPFTPKMTYRLRQEWLSDLNRAFRGDVKRFRTDTNKILFALDHMDRKPRNRWESHIRMMREEERDAAESSWSTFEKWTTTCVVDLANQDSQVTKLLNTNLLNI